MPCTFWGGPASANQLLLVACGIDAPWWTGLLVLIVLQAGSVPPALPGRLGVYNYLTVIAVGVVGVDAVPAAAYSIALYIVAYLPNMILGAIFFAGGDFGDWARLKALGLGR